MFLIENSCGNVLLVCFCFSLLISWKDLLWWWVLLEIFNVNPLRIAQAKCCKCSEKFVSQKLWKFLQFLLICHNSQFSDTEITSRYLFHFNFFFTDTIKCFKFLNASKSLFQMLEFRHKSLNNFSLPPLSTQKITRKIESSFPSSGSLEKWRTSLFKHYVNSKNGNCETLSWRQSGMPEINDIF